MIVRARITKRVFALALCALVDAGCVEHRVVYVQDPPGRPPPAGSDVVMITEPPPEPQVEVIGSAPGPQYVWIPGNWQWHSHWVWVSGHWAVAPHPQAVWVPGRWHRHGQGWVWIHGYWR